MVRHNDFPLTIRELFSNDVESWNFDSNLSENPKFKGYSSDHTDLPRLRKGQVGGQFWSAYMGCSTQYTDATPLYMEQIDVIKRFVAKYPNDMTLVTTAQGLETYYKQSKTHPSSNCVVFLGIRNAFQEKKIASMIGVESGHAIASSLGVLRLFYETGARYMTLTHSCNTPWYFLLFNLFKHFVVIDCVIVRADTSESESGNEPVRNNGLSEFGKVIIKEMNRLGMLVDISHVSADTMRDTLEVSRAPVMFSHSSAREIYGQARNVPDDVLEQVVSA